MEDFSYPKSLKVFLDFIEQEDLDCLDFEVEEHERGLVRLLSDQLAQYFIEIGKHGSESLICYWKFGDDVSWDQAPIVWIDSEGSPNSVFASTTDEFLSLLPLGTGGIYDLISSWQNYNSDPEYCVSPIDKYAENSDYLQSLIQLSRENHSDYDIFIEWLEKELNIKLCDDPVKLIGDNIAKFPDLDSWLEGKGY